MTIVFVSGALANRHLNGGGAWVRLSWVLGLKKLGFKVYFIEQIGREACVDASGSITPFEDSANLTYFRRITNEFGLSGSAALIYESGEKIYGPPMEDLLDAASAAELLVNISGHLTWEPLLRRPRLRVYLDLDPGFTQFWQASGIPGARLEGHDFFFTIGENIGNSRCPIPKGDIHWRTTRQPVVLEDWPVSFEGDPQRFTTVANWRGPYGPVKNDGKTYGLKAHEFRKFVQLPRHVKQSFEVALNIHPADDADLRLLHSHGWQIVDPQVAVPDPSAFRRYVQTSGAEFSVAQGIYVETQSGWFSDRTVRYLASGKPALVQDTGFAHHYPVGEGLLAFRTLEESVDGANRIARDYQNHCKAARSLAETYFDSDKVLDRLLVELGIAP